MPKNRSSLTRSRSLIQPKPLGMVLQEAHLIAYPKIEVALKDQEYYPYLRLGEILVMRGWIKQETIDFFVHDWWELTKQRTRKRLGYYLQKAALLEAKHIEAILEEQKKMGIRFGSVAVLQGLLDSETIDFFLMNLFPQEFGTSSLMGKSQIKSRKYQQSSNRVFIPDNFKQNTYQRLVANQPQIEDIEATEIRWID